MKPSTRFTAAIIAAALVTTGISQIATAGFAPPVEKDLQAPITSRADTRIQNGEGNEAWDGWTKYPFSSTDWNHRPLGVHKG